MMRNLAVTGLVSVIMGIFTIAYTSLVPPDRRPVMPSAGADTVMAAANSAGAMLSSEGVQLFRNRIQPLLAARCFRCHDAKTRSGGLDLTTRAGALAGGETGDAIVLGKPSESLLIQLVTAGEMPKEGSPLSSLEIADLKRWIALGAPYADNTAMTGGTAAGAMGSSAAGGGSAMSSGNGGAMGSSGGAAAGMNGMGGMSGMSGMKMCPCMQMMMGMGGGGGMMNGSGGSGSAAQATPATGLSNPRTIEQARQRAEAHLKGLGNPNLKTGEVRETLATFEVQVVTKDGSPVNWIIIQKKTGQLSTLY